MQVDFLIAGQGISGTMLSWFLHREGKSFVVVDDPSGPAASRVAAGVINPVTGRRFATSWMIDEIMPFAIDTYQAMEQYLDGKYLSQKSVVHFFPSPKMLHTFVERIQEGNSYLHPFPDQNHFNQYFNYEFGCGEIRPAYTVDLKPLLTAWRGKLTEWKAYRAERFEPEALRVEKDHVRYDDITASKVLFCDGAGGIGNPWFHLLPYAPNKGEALIIHSTELTNLHLFKKGMMLVPLQQPDTYWVGSNYQWEYENGDPSEAFLQQVTALLNQWLKKPYEVVEHQGAIRPATVERRPFVGLHPLHDAIGILNGMGSKGSSLAPYFASQLVQHLVHGLPITPDADVRRFSRVLSRQS